MRSVPSGMQDGVPMTFDALEVWPERDGPPSMSDKRKQGVAWGCILPTPP